jgi:hypothetical protein
MPANIEKITTGSNGGVWPDDTDPSDEEAGAGP